MRGVEVEIPLSVRLTLGRAAAQVVADSMDIGLLHIKGATVDPAIDPTPSVGTDVDVLIAPHEVSRYDAALRAHGWNVYSTFINGSPFGHAQTYLHDIWGYLDVHRHFPGIGMDAGRAFARLWEGRYSIEVAGTTCAVPSVDEQALLLILNAARSPAHPAPRFWAEASTERRRAIADLAAEFDASVAFAAATGDLDRFRGHRDYHLWRIVSSGGGRAEEWWARIRSARSAREALGVAARAPLVNTERLTHRLGRRPSPAEVAREFFRRPGRALAEAWNAAWHRGV